ncbi:hypothetical protein LEP1GSC083_1934 [Leptospira interrogans serovar Pyrogenes str. L0374]|uniref:Uncharacterized protein n=1 Tax=Leptospira interrogans serovar Pyrogenes str. L0374 TaxID=1049928 RepID=M6KLC0_LEPIR|nr:hypothetical protein LEP1GSC083_1934 [Leptospira interrogans serovar Pyrogenes str. L0374]
MIQRTFIKIRIMPKMIRLILWLLSIFLYTNLLFSRRRKNNRNSFL